MKNLISKALILTLTMSVVPALAFAKDLSTTHQETAPFHTLSELSASEGTVPTAMREEQLESVKGTGGICVACIIATSNNGNLSRLQNLPEGEALAREIVASTQAIIKQHLSQVGPLQDGEILAQEIVASTQASVKQMVAQLGPLQDGEKMRAHEIVASTQASMKQQLSQLPLPDGETLAREIQVSTQAIISQHLSQLQNLPENQMMPQEMLTTGNNGNGTTPTINTTNGIPNGTELAQNPGSSIPEINANGLAPATNTNGTGLTPSPGSLMPGITAQGLTQQIMGRVPQINIQGLGMMR